MNHKVPKDMFKNAAHVKTKCGNKSTSERFVER